MTHKEIIFGGGNFDLYIKPEVVLTDIKLERGFAVSTAKSDIESIEEDENETEDEY